jgi:flagellar hook-basal body complex protein FliE
MLQPTTLTTPIRPLELSESGTVQDKTAGPEFANLLEDAISRVEAAGSEAGRAVDGFLAGGPGDLHSLALAGQKAGLQFEMLLQVRNKIVQAYQEVMRMQL